MLGNDKNIIIKTSLLSHNYIALHSLSAWLKNAKEIDKQLNESVSSEEGLKDLYNSDDALMKAVESWMEIFNITRDTVQSSACNNEKAEKVAISLKINSLVHEQCVMNNDIEISNSEETKEKNNSEVGDEQHVDGMTSLNITAEHFLWMSVLSV